MDGFYYRESEIRYLLDAKKIVYNDDVIRVIQANVLPGVAYEPTDREPTKPFKITDKTLYEKLDELLESANEQLS